MCAHKVICCKINVWDQMETTYFQKYFLLKSFLFLDILNDPTLLEQFLEEYKLQYEEMQQNYSVYQECVVPIVTQSFGIMWYILFFCLVIRVVACIKTPRSLLHLASAIFGIICLWKFYEEALTFVLLPSVLSLVLQIRKLPRGLCISLMSITYIIAW